MSSWMRVGGGSPRTCLKTYQRNFGKEPLRMSSEVCSTSSGGPASVVEPSREVLVRGCLYFGQEGAQDAQLRSIRYWVPEGDL